MKIIQVNGKEFTWSELQEILLMLGNKGFYRFLGMSDPKARDFIKEYDLIYPVDYVRDMNTDSLALNIALHGSTKAFADHYSVSDSFVRTLFLEKIKAEGQWISAHSPSGTDDPLPSDLKAELTRCGSVSIVARLYGVKDSVIRRAAKSQEIDISKYIDYSQTGFENAKGRRAEKIFAELRGPKILKDMNIDEGSQADYDFLDADWKRVNVKASQRYKYKAKSRGNDPYFYKISLESVDKCDYVAVMCMNKNFTVVKFAFMVPASLLKMLGTKTWSFSESIQAFMGKKDGVPYITLPVFRQFSKVKDEAAVEVDD